jgi:hypothetical protein
VRSILLNTCTKYSKLSLAVYAGQAQRLQVLQSHEPINVPFQKHAMASLLTRALTGRQQFQAPYARLVVWDVSVDA